MLVSAAIAGGTPHRIVDLASDGRIRIVASRHLLAELSDVLTRERFLRWRTREQLDQFYAEVCAVAEITDDPAETPPETRDPKDDYLVALARAAHADAICSGDGDLADVAGIEVLTPAQLLPRLIEHD